jgi:hypothetical protein
MYITPERFRAMGFGLDLTDVEDIELRQTIARASALIDAYCAVPMVPQKHDFRGGTITNEQHSWPLPDVSMLSRAGTRRVYIHHRPITEVTAFRVDFTNTFGLDLDKNNLYVNYIENWAEVVSLAAVVSGVYPVGINFGLYTPVAKISYKYGWSIPQTGDYLEPTDADEYRASHQWWHTSPTPKVYIDSVLQTTGYTVNYDEGTVVFNDALTATQVVTADYNYKLPEPIADACGFMVAHLLGERDLQQKGMAGIGMLKVAEVELRRESMGRRATTAAEEMEPEIAALLAPFVYSTVR